MVDQHKRLFQKTPVHNFKWVLSISYNQYQYVRVHTRASLSHFSHLLFYNILATTSAPPNNVIGKNAQYPTANHKESQAPRLLILDGDGSHVNVEFMWECKRNNVELLFLPSHSSHVLQPLDLGTFSPLKSRYQKEIADLACRCCRSQEATLCPVLSETTHRDLQLSLLSAGWVAADLYPWNPPKGPNSSQIHVTTNPPPPETPRTDSHGDPSTIFPTPKHPRDICHSMQQLPPASGTAGGTAGKEEDEGCCRPKLSLCQHRDHKAVNG